MARDANYNLHFDFEIDDGQLDGLTPQMMFTLGVEFGRVYQEVAEIGLDIETQIHVENLDRVQRLVDQEGWVCHVRQRDDHWVTVKLENPHE